jgi:hypothetical protein
MKVYLVRVAYIVEIEAENARSAARVCPASLEFEGNKAIRTSIQVTTEEGVRELTQQ